MNVSPQRLIIGVTGASGICYAQRLLEILRKTEIETHLVFSKAAQLCRAQESELSQRDFNQLADVHYSPTQLSAAIASGSFKSMGMIITPCSMRTLAEIATGNSSSLLTRAADVVLKERRRLVLMVRETPLHQVHLQNMLTITQMGGIIAPPIPAFYLKPNSLTEMVEHSLARILDLFNIEVDSIPSLNQRWGETIKNKQECTVNYLPYLFDA